MIRRKKIQTHQQLPSLRLGTPSVQSQRLIHYNRLWECQLLRYSRTEQLLMIIHWAAKALLIGLTLALSLEFSATKTGHQQMPCLSVQTRLPNLFGRNLANQPTGSGKDLRAVLIRQEIVSHQIVCNKHSNLGGKYQKSNLTIHCLPLMDHTSRFLMCWRPQTKRSLYRLSMVGQMSPI